MPQFAKFRTPAALLILLGGIFGSNISHAIAPPASAPAPAPATVGPVVKTVWSSVELFNARAGWMKSSETTSNGEIETELLMEFSISRGPTAIKMRVATLFVETEDGKPIRMKTRTEMAAAPATQEYTFLKDEVEITTISAAADGTEVRETRKKSLPAGDWLTPAKLSRITKEKIRAGEKKFSLQSIDPSAGMDIATMEREFKGNQTITIGDKSFETTKWATITRNSAGGSVTGTEYLDTDLEPVRSEVDLGAYTMVTIRTDASITTQKFVAPEMMVQLFVKPDKTIPSPRELKNATYLLSVKAGEISSLPSTGAQKFEKLDAQSGRVTVTAKNFAAATAEERKDPAYLNNSAMVAVNDPLIKSIHDKALKDKAGLPARDRAELLRRYVFKYISHKELGTGFAGAAEVAKTRSGDCSEHGVLLAALLRADGIPSRVVSGAICGDFAGQKNVFGYHMWTQALIEIDGEPRWVDFDSTLEGNSQPFDAAHIAIAVSALEDGELNGLMMNLIPLLGQLEIKVEKLK